MDNSTKIALVALVLTIPGYVKYAYDWFQGSEVKMYATPIIDFRSATRNIDGPTIATANMTFHNSGGTGYDEVIHHQYLKFTLGRKLFFWTGFYNVDLNPTEKTWVPIKNSVKPFTLRAGDSYSKEVAFYPLPVICSYEGKCTESKNAVTWKLFKELILNTSNPIPIVFESHDISGNKYETSCVIHPKEQKGQLRNRKKMRAQYNCWPL